MCIIKSYSYIVGTFNNVNNLMIGDTIIVMLTQSSVNSPVRINYFKFITKKCMYISQKNINI